MEHNWPRKPVVLPSLFKSEPHTTLRPLVSVIHRAPSPLQHPRAPPATSSFYHHYHHSCETHRAPQYSRTHESNHIVIKREPTSYGSSYEQQQRYKLPVLSDMLHGGSRHSPQQSAVVSAPTPKSSLSFILDGHAPAAREDQLEDPEYFRASNSSATSSLMSEEDEALMNRYIDQHQHEIMSHHHQPHHEQRLKTNGKRRVSRPASRTCKYEGCDQYVVDHGLCVRHGGGKRCMTEGCTSRAKHFGRCWRHGGSMECKVTGCANRAKSRGFCWSHGGGTKCKSEPCEKIAISNGLCWAHGGGKRCVVDGCMKQAYERTQNYCNSHYQQWKRGHALPLIAAAAGSQ